MKGVNFLLMTAIYILSANPKTANGPYKIGIHTGPIEKLKSRYITALPNHKIHFWMETPDASAIENHFKNTYIAKRIANNNDKLSEWYELELSVIYAKLGELISTIPVRPGPVQAPAGPVQALIDDIPLEKIKDNYIIDDFIRNHIIIDSSAQFEYKIAEKYYISFRDTYKNGNEVRPQNWYSSPNFSDYGLTHKSLHSKFYTGGRFKESSFWERKPHLATIVIKGNNTFYSIDPKQTLEEDNLFFACEKGDLEEVNRKLTLGATGLNDGLAVASFKGHHKIIDLLLSKGANDYNEAAKTALAGGHIDIFKRMLKLGANNYSFLTLLASRLGYMNIVEKFFDIGVNNFEDCIIEAAIGGYGNIIKLAIKLGSKDTPDRMKYFTKVNDYSRRADENVYLDVVKYLVEQGANLHDNLLYGAEHGYLDIVKCLVERGADTRDKLVLILAARNGHLNVVKYLVERRGKLRIKDEEALRSSAMNGHLNVVKYLVEKGVNLHDKDEEALKRAAGNGHLDVVKYLVEQGANLQGILDNPEDYKPEIVDYIRTIPLIN